MNGLHLINKYMTIYKTQSLHSRDITLQTTAMVQEECSNAVLTLASFWR